MPIELAPIVAATARWLVRAFPAPETGAFSAALVELQARQAATVAAWLRYPTDLDAELLTLTGPGGSAGLDWLIGVDADRRPGRRAVVDPWRASVDEVVASWATCMLTDSVLAMSAVDELIHVTGAVGLAARFRRLLEPDTRDAHAGMLLRHPDLVAMVAERHRMGLYDLLLPVARAAAV
jgi:hypothetical protein